MSRLTRPLSCCLLLVSLGVCNLGCREPSLLEQSAALAKARGETSTRVVMIPDHVENEGLADIAGHYDFVIARNLPERSQQIVGRETIRTWHVFSTIELLHRNASPAECSQTPPPTLALTSGEFAILMFSGTTIIDGVAVTFAVPRQQLQLQSDMNYLLVGSWCDSSQRFVASFGSLSVFEISASGSIHPHDADSPFRFTKELVAVGTIEQLKGALTSLSSQGR